jgi:CheY-like chemotaxis protein
MAKILLVEDDEMNRDMLSRRLERRGYQVVITTSTHGVSAAALGRVIARLLAGHRATTSCTPSRPLDGPAIKGRVNLWPMS